MTCGKLSQSIPIQFNHDECRNSITSGSDRTAGARPGRKRRMTTSRRCLRPALILLLFVGMLPAFAFQRPTTARNSSSLVAQEPIQAAQVIADNYIVVLRDTGIGAADVTASFKASKTVKVKQEYTSAFKGFSAEMSEAEAETLKNDPRVASIEPDRLIYMPEATLGESIDRVNAEL